MKNISFDKVKNLSTTFDKAKVSDKPTNPTVDSNTNLIYPVGTTYSSNKNQFHC